MGKGDKKSKKGKIFRHSYGKSRLRKKQLGKKLKTRLELKSTIQSEKPQPLPIAGKPPLTVTEIKQEAKPELKEKEPVVEMADLKPAEEIKKVESVSVQEPKQEKKAAGQKGRPRKKKEE